MVDRNGKMTFDVVTRREDAHGSNAHCKDATISLACFRQIGSAEDIVNVEGGAIALALEVI